MSKRQEEKTAKDREFIDQKLEQIKARMRAEGKFSDKHNVPTAIVEDTPDIYFTGAPT